jgi:hypothetical protein
MGDVAGTVVGHDGLDTDAAALEPGDRAFEEACGGGGSFIGEYLGVGEAGSVVDGDVDELPTDAASVVATVTGDAMADATDASELFDIHVDELAGVLSLVTADGFFGVQVFKSREAMTSEDASDRGSRKAHTGSDLRACVAAPTKTDHLLGPIRVDLPGHAVRPRAAIEQGRLTGFLISPFPLESGPSRESSRRGGPGRGHPAPHSLDQHESTGRATSGILVKLHLGSSGRLMALDTSSLTDLDPDGQLLTQTVNNVLRNEN